MHPKRHLRILFLCFCMIATNGVATEKIWLLIDTSTLQLKVMQGQTTLATLDNIAIGRNGAGFKRAVGDEITPLGSYKIGWINKKSPFYRFYGFTYPSLSNANEALINGLISKKKHTLIVNAHKNKKIPPQNTPIGGNIGIHGLGKANQQIHQQMNWTQGCIALTNEQIDQLAQWIYKDMEVEVK